MAVRLEVQTTDPEQIALAKRYWAMDEEGLFLERVRDLLPFREVTQAGSLAAYLRTFCEAYDENQVCPRCDGPVRIKGRSEARRMHQVARTACHDCQAQEQRARLEREAKERAALTQKLAPYIEHLQTHTLCYAELPDDAVLVLQAIRALIGPRLSQGTFSRADCSELTALGADDFIDRLCEQGVLLDDPAVMPNAYFLKEDQVWVRKHQARYRLSPDADLGRSEQALDVLMDRTPCDTQALTRLWLDYATQDVLRYLRGQCDIHSLVPEPEAVDKLVGTIRQALHTYSVAQVWAMSWKIVRDAAALASRSYYNHAKAAATLPGKLRKQLELAEPSQTLRNDWSRPEPHIAGALGMVFLARFDIDEYSTGDQVLALFAHLGQRGKPEARLDTLATRFVTASLARATVPAALKAFADCIQAGLDVEQALTQVMQQCPEVFG
ncbi:hypothetical protein G7Z99_01420 [Pseudomonas entomophila]|uniref:hypothetical protein n=1 Tax=Pseudomonas entomophila TaxID=312306 RepID=UPI0015E2F308|nr:hypothetical protein [Pseudomonas entomophila]MBA1187704.1 hypothetical protein [Pseudomonas entomophila]